MNELAYLPAATVPAALRAGAAQPGSMYLAGGTTLVDLLREGVFRPDVLVDLGGLPLREIRIDGERTRIGALVSNSEVAWNPGIRRMFPVVVEAILAGASGQIRNMASTGGNLLQRTRCPYFRDLSAPCNRRQAGAGCAALEGVNRSHAILGGSEHCIATHASDFAVALTAADAEVEITGAAGVRSIPITGLYLLPGAHPERETTLEPGELITAVLLPHARAHGRSLYLKVRDRQSYEFALASAAVVAEEDGGLMRNVRVALGGVGTVPWRARGAETVLEGHPPAPPLFAAAADAELAAAVPRRHNGFKVPLARNTLVSALRQWAAMS